MTREERKKEQQVEARLREQRRVMEAYSQAVANEDFAKAKELVTKGLGMGISLGRLR